MMTRRGHTVYHYGHEKSEVECTEHVPVTYDEDLEKAYGDYNWRKNFFTHNTADHAHQIFNKRGIVEVGKRKQPGDFLLCFWGFAHQPIADAHPDLIAVEPGIGCTNKPFTKQSIFESYAVMNSVYGKYDQSPHWYDAVIPNYFDVEDFEFNEKPKDYFLFVGRIIESKGVGIAIDVTKRLGVKLIVAGQGDLSSIRNPIPDHVEVIGYVEPKERSNLMKNAKALLAPTHYNEPFGGVTIEALFCGTPTITTDWGGFAENNIHGLTGYRCRTIEQFVWAAKNIDKISRRACREWAVKNFSLERISLMYEEYFKTLSNVYNGSGGFYATDDSRKELDWMKRYYPTGTECSSPWDSLVEFQPPDVLELQSMTLQTLEDVSATNLDPCPKCETGSSEESNKQSDTH